MSFIHTALLAGLGAIAIPIILHLLNRRTAKVLDWGAMQFLLDSIESRRRRIEMEEALLMACRCLLFGLLALAVARPFAPPGSSVPWVAVLPAFLLGLVALSTAVVLRGNRRYFWWLLLTGLVLFGYCAASILYERLWNQKRYGTTGQKDIVIIIDGSTSMQLRGSAGTNFDAAVKEAREIVEKTGGGSAFGIILGGPVPMARVPVPVVNKNDVFEALSALQPVRGRMAAFDCLARAAESLAQGTNPNKEIIILTDGQNIGWETENRARWDAFIEGMAGVFKENTPQVMLRRYPLPASFRNAAVASVTFSRDVIGTDRPVGIEVTVENTGTESVTPTGVEVLIGGQKLEDKNIGQLSPGGRETIRFPMQFKEPGNHVVTARVLVNDELALDDESAAVCHVVDRLGVLVIDGNPSGGALSGAARFTALALLPDKLAALVKDPKNEETRKSITIEPLILPVSRAGSIPSLQPYDVIILADVPRLPEGIARRVASWVQAGGGLLVTPGSRAEAAFYNNWRSSDGAPFLPALLSSAVTSQDGQGAAINTFTHSALAPLADPKRSDLGGLLLHQYWRLDNSGVMAAGSFTGARLANGDAFLTVRRTGFGTVMLTCANFDTESGNNVPTRQCFVPMVHQLVHHLANPEGQPFNRAPAGQINLPLSSGGADGGLKGEYFRQRQFDTPLAVRIDPQRRTDKPDEPPRFEYQWGGASPMSGVPEDFSVRWTGAIIARYSEEYTFDGWADDRYDLYIDDKRIIERNGEGKARLEAGRFHRIRIDMVDESGNAGIQLHWRSQSQQREVIPAECLTPFPPGSSDQQSEAGLGRMAAIGPDKAERAVDVVFTRAGLVARLSGDVVPGLYQIQVPKDRARDYARIMAADGTIPFAVVEDASESRLAQLSPTELDFLRKRLALLEPADAKQALDILAGREFGEELWKYLAVAALFILLLEIALTRWIAISRRSGEQEAVNFETRFDPSQQFQSQLKKVREAAAG